MRNRFFSLLALVAILVAFTAFTGVTASAQAVSDNVTVEAGVTHVGANANVGNGLVEVQKVLTQNNKLMFDGTLFLSDNPGTGTGQVISGQALLRGYAGKYVFGAGGVTVGKLVNTNFDTQTFLNPSIQGGVTVPVGKRVVIEPFVQFDTPDLRSDNRERSLTFNVTTSISVNERFGFTSDIGITQTRIDNSFLKNGRGIPYALGGIYVNF